MIYGLLRWITGIALHWFYSDLRINGLERIPLKDPIILAASHHNALVDCLVVGWLVPRKITITAKATLRENRFVAALFSVMGVVSLRRTSDELKHAREGMVDRGRNLQAFDDILKVLEQCGAVLIFPEGKSHSEPQLAPLKTGAARIALAAHDVKHIPGVQIVPLGINFENKGAPGSSVVAEVGDILEMDREGSPEVERLTAELERRLSIVSLKPPLLRDSSGVHSARKRNTVKAILINGAAAWGELTHRDVIGVAREIALRKSHGPDEPAMLTILYGLFLILASYAIQVSVLWVFIGFWWAVGYLITLPIGAYWAAFKDHPTAVRLPLAA